MNLLDQLIYEIVCDELPYTRYSPLEVLKVQTARRRRMEELSPKLPDEGRSGTPRGETR